ncbi:MAG: hypothetical protein IKX88_00675 [Thermoguttaceae bacterium]|nr:hypothetical protein [Thermoguttaceae bacterium]MBR5757096.1 hypothetical protein [Thermoguttaceae bacterium]
MRRRVDFNRRFYRLLRAGCRFQSTALRASHGTRYGYQGVARFEPSRRTWRRVCGSIDDPIRSFNEYKATDAPK